MQSQSQEPHATHFPESQKPQKLVISNRAGVALEREGSHTCRTGHDGCPWRATTAGRTLQKQSRGQRGKHEHCSPSHVFKHLPRPSPGTSHGTDPPLTTPTPEERTDSWAGGLTTYVPGDEEEYGICRDKRDRISWIPSGHSQDPQCPLSLARMGVPAGLS